MTTDSNIYGRKKNKHDKSLSIYVSKIELYNNYCNNCIILWNIIKILNKCFLF